MKTLQVNTLLYVLIQKTPFKKEELFEEAKVRSLSQKREMTHMQNFKQLCKIWEREKNRLYMAKQFKTCNIG